MLGGAEVVCADGETGVTGAGGKTRGDIGVVDREGLVTGVGLELSLVDGVEGEREADGGRWTDSSRLCGRGCHDSARWRDGLSHREAELVRVECRGSRHTAEQLHSTAKGCRPSRLRGGKVARPSAIEWWSGRVAATAEWAFDS